MSVPCGGESDTAALGAAMVAYIEAHAKHARRRQDGIVCEAFHRDGDNVEALRVWQERATWKDARANVGGGARDFARIVARVDLGEFMRVWGHGSPPPAAAKPPRTHDPRRLAHEATGLWAQASTVQADEDAEVAAWLASRGLDAGRVADAGVVSVIRKGAKVPPWARCCGRSWAGDYRLITPLRNANGQLVSLHARRISSDETLPKTASPAGVTTRGLLMANALGRGLLRGAPSAIETVLSISRDTARAAVVIVEGFPAFLAWCADATDADEHAPAVFGMMSGSWTAEHAARIPDGARVVVDTDHGDKNSDGDRYAAHIASTFDGRSVELGRMTRDA